MLPVRLAAGIATVIAALALGLSVVGLYSLVSYLVAERTHEIGLRVALGARSVDVLRLVLGYGLKLVLLGMAIGIPTAFASSRLLGSLLYGVSPTDPGVFLIASSAVLAIAAAACYAPARRAMRMDPLDALRRVYMGSPKGLRYRYERVSASSQRLARRPWRSRKPRPRRRAA
jgi:ABC-type antimicrobial peptide transport system permease subunit